MSEPPLQLVLPMAGRGSRFIKAGYSLPKPLLPVHGFPMFSIVLANLWTIELATVVLVTQRSLNLKESVSRIRSLTGIEVELVEIDYVTGGAADSVDLARDFLDPDLPLVTANSDQYVDASLDPFFAQLQVPGVAGCMLTMQDSDPKWSYAQVDAAGYVSRVVEKRVISKFATVGIYGFASAGLAFNAFDAMRMAGDSVNGEYYIAPAYNQMIEQGFLVTSYDLGPIMNSMHGMGIPHDYETFLMDPASRRAADKAKTVFGGQSDPGDEITRT